MLPWKQQARRLVAKVEKGAIAVGHLSHSKTLPTKKHTEPAM